MVNTHNLYQSILLTLGQISSEDLVEVDAFFKTTFTKKAKC
jgi:hypothetical protein